MKQELLLLTNQKTKDPEFELRMDALIAKIIQETPDINSGSGVCISYQGNHSIHTDVQNYCRKRSVGFKKITEITPANISEGRYCVEYTKSYGIRKLLKSYGIKTHKP